MRRLFCVLSTARNHERFPITFELYLESPLQDPTSETVETVLVERHAIYLQVSNTYSRNPNSKILLITNPKTAEGQSQAIQHFIRSNLWMELDLCNIHQNDSLLRVLGNELDNPLPVMSAYRQKTVLVLDNAFEFFGTGEWTTSRLHDPQ